MEAQHPAGRDALPGSAVQWTGPAWLVVAVEHQADEKARSRLHDLGLDPRLFLIRRHIPATRVRPAAITLDPAFPGYLIVRAAPADRELMRRDYKRGIIGPLTAVGQPTKPALLPDEAMLALIAIAARNRHAGSDCLLGEIAHDGTLQPIPEPHDPLPDLTGEALLVVDPDSPIAGMVGACMRSAADRVVLLLQLLGADRRVTVARSAVRRA